MPKHKASETTLLPQISPQETSSLSKLQQQFNNKIKKVNKLKQELKEKGESLELAKKRLQKEVQPLIDQLLDKRIALVKLFDKLYDLSFFRKREKEKLAMVIEDLTYTLITSHGHEELTELHDKYAKRMQTQTIAEADEAYKSMAEDVFKDIFGFKVDLDNPDFEDIQARLDREMEEREQEKRNRQSARKETKAQAKQKVELQNISKASRRVYTDLAKRLHPDVEQDPEVKAWKEEVMKKVTNAYQHDDFFALLQLQMEFMQEQTQALGGLPEDQLKYYIKMLNKQLQDLQEQEYHFVYGPYANLYYHYGGTPKQMDLKFKRAKTDLAYELEGLNRELKAFEDPQLVREFLKTVR